MTQNFDVTAGVTKFLEIDLVDTEGEAFDLTLCKLTWTLRTERMSKTNILVKTNEAGGDITVPTSPTNSCIIKIDELDTVNLNGVFYHSLLVEPLSGGSDIPVYGYVTISRR